MNAPLSPQEEASFNTFANGVKRTSLDYERAMKTGNNQSMAVAETNVKNSLDNLSSSTSNHQAKGVIQQYKNLFATEGNTKRKIEILQRFGWMVLRHKLAAMAIGALVGLATLGAAAALAIPLEDGSYGVPNPDGTMQVLSDTNGDLLLDHAQTFAANPMTQEPEPVGAAEDLGVLDSLSAIGSLFGL